MTNSSRQNGNEMSLFAVVTAALRHRWLIVGCVVIATAISVFVAVRKPLLYMGSASFLPQGSDGGGRSALSGLAGQFGISVPFGNQSLSPEFYAAMVKSPAVLRKIARDTFVVQEHGGSRMALVDVFDIPAGTPARREEQGIAQINNVTSASVEKTTGAVRLTVATRWPSVSLNLTTALIDGVNDLTQRTRQAQATSERKFVEGRLAAATASLREVEDRLQEFVNVNRQFTNSPQLSFQRDRLQRDVDLQQQVFSAQTLALEDVRVREVRNTPVITMLDEPSVPTQPEPRGRIKLVLMGFVVGAFLGVLIAFASELLSRESREGNPEIDELVRTIGEVKSGMRGGLRRLAGRGEPSS